ncbi:TonB-dependent receptor [Parvularcula marina]|uniref:TonB-dependent receptor n=1 Tax=Parvularcula marina TaxID=2292771 RepID=A0A371RKK3_9PROT|nr:TonB-dependent receptor [Parvularcula marina]RFB05978.1 TonB-dependent receptor [Parvularcula marina]
MTGQGKFVRLLLGASVLTMAGALPATAQDTTDTQADDDVVVVTGFRQSLAASLDVKKEETGVVDAIVAEDIADFPDLNLAESLQRIPGIAIDRQAGEGRRVTVRGLGGDFTRVRINGMEALSTTGGSDASGGTNRSRAFDFNTFAAELFNQLVVRKTQSASVEEGSLGANVELKTAQPFDYSTGWTGAASVQGLYNDLIEETSPRMAGLVSYTNPDKTFGWLASIAYSDRTIREEGFSTVRFDDLGTFRSVNGEDCSGNPTGGACEEVRNSYYARIPRYGRLDYEQERLGLTGSVQFAPSDQTTISIDGLYSVFEGSRDENFMEVFIRSNTDNIDITDYVVDGDGVLSYFTGDVQADLSNGIIPVRSERRKDKLKTEFNQLTFNVEHEFNDAWRGNVFAGHSKSEFSIPQQATVFFDAASPVEGYMLDFRNNLETPLVDFGNFDVTSPSSYLFTQFRNRPQGVDNTFDTFQGNLSWDYSDNVTLQAGVSWKKFEFATEEVRAEGSVTDVPGVSAFIPVTADLADQISGFGSGLDLPSGVDTSWLTPDFDAAADLVDLFSFGGAVREQDTRSVEEEDTGAYVQAVFNGMWGEMPVRGDIGVRYVETETAATGFLSGDQVTVSRKYDDWLPAVNLVFEPKDDFLIRGGIAKVMARPSLGNLTPGGSIDTFNGPPFGISQGNPGLDPFRATTYDVSFEYYFAEESLFAVGLFYKDIDSFFTNADTITTTFSQTGLPDSVAGATSPLGELLAMGQDPAVEIDQVVNGDSASVQGMEIVYQQPFTFLPVEGFGFVGNYTFVDSDDIIGFSENSWNATLYYENAQFQARLTGAYRDEYQTRRPNGSGRTEGREERGVADTFNLDFASSYAVNESLELTFEAINLTDEFEHQTFDTLMLPTLYHHTGRNFIFGARYSF